MVGKVNADVIKSGTVVFIISTILPGRYLSLVLVNLI